MVSGYSAQSYDLSLLRKVVAAHFQDHGLKERLSHAKRVVLKPNLLMRRRPEDATTTHPALVEAVILELQALGAPQILLAESSGGLYNRQAILPIYKACGMEEVARRTGISLNEDFSSRYLENPNGAACRGFEIITPIAEGDFIISLPKLKTHSMAGMSGGVKNLFGCIPGLLKPEYHWRFPKEEDFCNMLLDLCETVKPSLTLVDAVISMEGDGPSSGNPRETNFTFCSDSPYELDEYLCRFIGRDPKEIATVRLARERGLCPDFEKIIYQGESFSPVNLCPPSTKKQLDFLNYLPRSLRPAAKKAVEAFLSPRPEIDRKSCVGCGKCAESCPAHTIRVQDGKAEILRENCIKCYCCHEMCPIHAVTIRRSRILRL